MNKINYLIFKIFGFKRHNILKISDKAIELIIKQIEIDGKNDFGKIWNNILKKYKKTQNEFTDSKDNLYKIKTLFENFFVNGLSDGACVGSSLKNPRIFFKYLFRTRIRKYKVDKFDDFSCSIKHIKFDNLNYSPILNSGRPWLLNINGKFINPEFYDHYYFFKSIFNDYKKFKNCIFIGDGSGILSNFILNNCKFEKVYFVDLPHFLIRQAIVNSEINIKQIYLTPGQFLKAKISKGESYCIFNQDSFPEIKKQYLISYIKLFIRFKIKTIFSYNKKDLNSGHINFQKILNDLNFKSIYCMESVIRKNYYIEKYSYD